jgi:putative ABC transport system permease protein
MHRWWSKIERVLGRRTNLGSELEQEIDAHIEFLIDKNLERGMAPADARAAARREFGNRIRVRERSYQSWQFLRFESLLQDIGYALRGIVKAPGFSLMLIVTLAVGIGANTAIFSAVYAVLLKPLPYPAAERLVWLGESNAKATGISVTWVNFEHWRAENHSFEAMAGFRSADLTLTGRGQATLTHAGLVTNQFFQLTGSRPLMGRLLTASDDQEQSPATALLTESFWAKSLSADPEIIGKTMTLDGAAYEIVGVLGRDPGFFLSPIDYYLPLRPTAAEAASREAHGSMRALALLRPGVTLAGARSDLDRILKRLAKADPGPEDDHRAYAEFLTEERTGSVRSLFALLMGSVCLVLILACANIGSLLLMRMTSRAREMAIRTAIGAGRRRLARQLVTETVLIAVLGGASGLLMAYAGLRVLGQLGPRNIPRLSEAGLNQPVLIFAAALTLAVGLVCALVPVLSLGRVNLSILLKEGSSGAGSNRFGHALRGTLVVAEIAAAVVLLFSSGILLRSLWIAETANPGFDPGHLLGLQLQLPASRYRSDAATVDFYDRLEAALRRQPGVESVGAVNCAPAAGDCGDWWYSVSERPAPGRPDVPMTLLNMADAAYFKTMKIRLVAGRGPSDEDRATAPAVAIINEEIAHAWWRDARSALGEHIKLGGPYLKGPLVEIVGVAANVPQMGLDSPPLPEIYFPAAQRVSSRMMILIRTQGTPDAVAGTVSKTLASLDSNVPIQSLTPFDEWLGATLIERRFVTFLLAVFAAIAVILAAIGCYGVLNYWVNSRKQEIAIRMAMGAGTFAIIRRTASQAARLGLLGLAIGLAASWGASRSMSSLVFGIGARDPMVFGAAALAAMLMVLLAAVIPLWRAVRVQPLEMLHEA